MMWKYKLNKPFLLCLTVSIVMKRLHDYSNFYKGKYLIEWFTILDVLPIVIMVGNVVAYR